MKTRSTRVTIADVAREAGVSEMTVSRVLNEKGDFSEAAREKVLSAVERLGYRPSRIARSLATSRSYNLAMVSPGVIYPFYADIALGAEDEAWKHQFSLLVSNHRHDASREEHALQLFEDAGADGVLVLGSQLPDDRFFELLARYPAAVVFNREGAPSNVDTIFLDNVDGAGQAVTHLLDGGRRRIGLITGPRELRSTSDRIEGYRRVLQESGVEVDERRTIASTTDRWEAGHAATLELLKADPSIDAIVCYNDIVALGAIRACSQLGRLVPEDVAIIGCDDLFFAPLLVPSLTTLHTPRQEIGARAVAMLLERLNGRSDQASVTIRQSLVVRDSTPGPTDDSESSPPQEDPDESKGGIPTD